MFFPCQSLTNSLRSEPRQQIPHHLPQELTLPTQLMPLAAPTRKLNGQKMHSLPCRRFSEILNVSIGHLKVSAPNDCGVVSDLHLLVALMPQCCSSIQRSNMFTVHCCVAFYSIWCINLLVLGVLPVELNLICNAPPKEDNWNLSGVIWMWYITAWLMETFTAEL